MSIVPDVFKRSMGKIKRVKRKKTVKKLRKKLSRSKK